MAIKIGVLLPTSTPDPDEEVAPLRVGQAAEMLGVTPTVKAEAPPPKARPQQTQPRS